MLSRTVLRIAVIVCLVLVCATLIRAGQAPSGTSSVQPPSSLASGDVSHGVVGTGHAEWAVIGLLTAGGLFIALRPRRRDAAPASRRRD